MEDIDKLISDSHTQDTLLFIDSKLRDRLVYPNPEEYTIRFSKPLRNVFSVKVIDSSIPRTHYTISPVSNSFVYRVLDNWKTAYVPIGNYTIDELIVVMNSLLQNVSVSHLSYPSDLRKQLLFKSEFDFEIDTKLSSIKYVLGLDCSVQNTAQTERGLILSSNDEPQFYDYVTSDDRLNFEPTQLISVNSDSVLYFTLPTIDDSYLHTIRFNIADVSERCDCVVSIVQLTNVGKNILRQVKCSIDVSTTIVQAVISDIRNELLKPNVFASISFSNFEFDSSSFHAKIPATTAIDTENTYSLTLQTNVSVTLASIEATSISAAINVQVTRAFKRQSIVAPGMYNLVGDTYVSLRCKEIDQHIGALQTANFTDGTGEVISKDFDYGLAVFKLGIVGYQDERFDYNTNIERAFFPIGKLNQLTFRFERWDGSLYDFKGVNHTFTLQIRFYAPKPNYTERANMTSFFNPSYNPEFIDY